MVPKEKGNEGGRRMRLGKGNSRENDEAIKE
jgi:hypothetical protein